MGCFTMYLKMYYSGSGLSFSREIIYRYSTPTNAKKEEIKVIESAKQFSGMAKYNTIG